MTFCIGKHFRNEVRNMDRSKIEDKVNFSGEYKSLKDSLPEIKKLFDQSGLTFEELDRHIELVRDSWSKARRFRTWNCFKIHWLDHWFVSPLISNWLVSYQLSELPNQLLIFNNDCWEVDLQSTWLLASNKEVTVYQKIVSLFIPAMMTSVWTLSV